MISHIIQRVKRQNTRNLRNRFAHSMQVDENSNFLYQNIRRKVVNREDIKVLDKNNGMKICEISSSENNYLYMLLL